MRRCRYHCALCRFSIIFSVPSRYSTRGEWSEQEIFIVLPLRLLLMIKTFISYDILVVVHGYLLLFIVYSISFWRGREAKSSISVPILGVRHWTQFIGDIYQHGQKYIGYLIKLKDVKLNDMLYRMFHSHWFVAEIKVVSLTHGVDVCSVAGTIILLFCSRNLSFIIT